MDAERKDGEQRRHEHGKDVVEQQEDGHQQDLSHDDALRTLIRANLKPNHYLHSL